MIRPVLYIYLISLCAGGLTNLFLKTGFDGSSTVYGTACLNLDYIPTCGWKFILYSSLPVTDMTGVTEFFMSSRIDNFTFFLNAVSKYADLTTMGLPCTSMEVKGNYASTLPDIIVNWYCVCNLLTFGSCKQVSVTSITEPTTTTTTTQPTSSTATKPTTTTTSAIKSTAASTTISTDTPPASPPVTASSSVTKYAIFTKRIDSCQMNFLTTVLLYNPDLIFCAIQCFNYENCTGVNYWEASQRCDIASKNIISNVTNVPGCQYYVITT
ncbi:mucin-2 [Biomphalaria pfeifferi]|uniref:Mucin-2 n=1 Tax=Biomphalaria pfeifferi TaxID=112525 RepID=A0AAD8BHQ0_BIOPF|nr:mucin-2 [Biomphalaria pfeifferi]